MFNSLLSDFRALWLVRSRVIKGNLAFILVIMGYDPRSRSINNHIYLVYALVFFALWIFMVLTLLADFGAKLLIGLPVLNPSAAVEAAAAGQSAAGQASALQAGAQTAVQAAAALQAAGAAQAALLLGTLALAALFLYDLFSATRRSPFSFSDVDAQVISMTPIDRRVVAFEWLFENWLTRGAGVWPAAIVLGYSLLQAQSARELSAADLPIYLIAGMRMFIIAVPLYLGTLGLAWAAGAWRLRGQVEQANLRWVSPLLVIVLVAAVGGFGLLAAANGLLPLSVPLRGGLGLLPLGAGLSAALGLAVVGLLALWLAANGMSLSRAAQESRDREAIQSAALLGRSDMAEELSQKQRLGTGRRPTRLPGRAGISALVWKGLLQSGRRFNIGQLFGWLGVFSTLLVLLLFAGGGTRGWSVVLFTMLALRQLISPLRKELSRWWLLRQLPYSSEMLAAAPLVLPVLGMWLAGAAALLAASLIGPRMAGGGLVSPLPAPLIPLAAWLYFASVPAIGLAGALDVLRQCKTGPLLAGNVADLSLLGMLLGLLVVAVNGGVAYFLFSAGNMVIPNLVIIAAVNAGVLYGLWNEAGNQMRRIQ